MQVMVYDTMTVQETVLVLQGSLFLRSYRTRTLKENISTMRRDPCRSINRFRTSTPPYSPIPIYILLCPSCGTFTTTFPQLSLPPSAFNALGTLSNPTYS